MLPIVPCLVNYGSGSSAQIPTVLELEILERGNQTLANSVASRGLINERIDIRVKMHNDTFNQLTWVDTCDNSHKRVKLHDESVLVEGILVLSDDCIKSFGR